MKISDNFVNTKLKEYQVKINWRSIMNYAASIEDDNPYYFDDEKDEGIIAPPIYAVAVTWPIIENMKDFIEAEKFPLKVLNTVVHYTEYIKIHRLIKPNDIIKINGEICAILPHRAGTHVVLCLKAFDKANNPIFTEYTGSILRGVKLEGNGIGNESIPVIQKAKSTETLIWEKEIKIDKLRSFIYDGCTNIKFAIHTSQKFAHFVGLPGIIIQGTATLAYVIKEITNMEANGNPKKIKEISCKFTDMVLPGTAIKLRVLEKKKNNDQVEIYFEVYNHEGKKAISNGLVVLK